MEAIPYERCNWSHRKSVFLEDFTRILIEATFFLMVAKVLKCIKRVTAHAISDRCFYIAWLIFYRSDIRVAVRRDARCKNAKMASHWALLHHPMSFVFFVLICDAWEICFILCKQRGQEYSYIFVYIEWSISPMHHQNTQTKGMEWWGSAQWS